MIFDLIFNRFVKAGDKVEEFDRLCEVQSDKASVEITSRFTGTVAELKYKVGDMAKVGSPLVEIETGDAAMEEAAPVDASTPAPEDGLKGRSHVVQDMNAVAAMMDNTPATKVEIPTAEHILTFATPAVRRVAKENSVDIALIKGSGKAGRVMKEDVMNYLTNGRQSTGTYPCYLDTCNCLFAIYPPGINFADQLLFFFLSRTTKPPPRLPLLSLLLPVRPTSPPARIRSFL